MAAKVRLSAPRDNSLKNKMASRTLREKEKMAEHTHARDKNIHVQQETIRNNARLKNHENVRDNIGKENQNARITESYGGTVAHSAK